jgi:lipoprotein-anchoring transpeptidase ErfK/SrfK
MQRVYQAGPVAVKAKPFPRQSSRLMIYVLVGAALAAVLLGVMIVSASVGIMVMVGSEQILPGVAVGGVPIGSLGTDEAATQLQAEFAQITVRDGARTWKVPAAQLGLAINAAATAQLAQQRGRGDGSLFTALLGGENVEPVFTVDAAAADRGVRGLSQFVNIDPVNATIRIVSGQLTPVPAVEGRILDVNATLTRIRMAAGSELADGAVDLVMQPGAPTVTDASALLEKTRVLLSSPLMINTYDPISNQSIPWAVAPDQWGQWLTTENTPSGVALSLDPKGLTAYLTGQNNTLTDARYIDVQKSVDKIRAAIAAGQAASTIRLYHKPTTYVIQPGDTIGSLSWKFGFPMFRIQNANPRINMNALSVGQTINIPSKDDMLPLPVVDNKRIVISISKQHMWVYENGKIKWDWIASTGIADSPTMPGVFQVQSHEKNAYAGNWNLWMPYFMGIYDAVPGFTNGIHGMPTRNGYGILWENSLGHPVTYGCILLSTANDKALYDWAEDGIVVEIQN